MEVAAGPRVMRFTIVIPTYDRPSRLSATLAAIARLDYPRDAFEVIVVDDGSPQPVDSSTRPYLNSISLTVLRQSNQGPAVARNRGAEKARGEWLAFFDDDCHPHPHWLMSMDAAARLYPSALLGGSTVNGCCDNVYAEVNQRLLNTVQRWMDERQFPLRFFASNNLAVSTREFHLIGGFNESFRLAASEDREFCARWLASGRAMEFVPEASMSHYHPQTFRSFLAMHYRYGKGAAGLHRSRGTMPLRLAAQGLYRRILFDESKLPGVNRATSVLLLALTQFSAAAGYFSVRR